MLPQISHFARMTQSIVNTAMKQTASVISTPGITALLHGFYAVPGITLLVEVGLVQRWLSGDRVDAAAFCQEHELDYTFIRTWCEYFRLYGYLDLDNDRYTATAHGQTILQRWPQVMLNHAYHPMMADLIPLARREKQYGYGKDVYRNMYFDSKGSGGLGAILSFVQIADYLQAKGHTCLLDLGCGDGTFLVTACKRIPGLRAIGLDQSEISVEEAEKNFARHGLAGRGQFVQGDISTPAQAFSNPALRQAEVATIMQILQEITGESTEPVLEFLASFRRHLPGVALAVTEFYRLSLDEMRAYVPAGVAESALHHDLSDQNLLPREQWLALYQQAGFRVVDSIVHLQAPSVPPVIETLVLRAD